MMITRRSMIAIGAAGMAANWKSPARTPPPAKRPSCTAIAFDAFALFDPRPAYRNCETAFPGRGTELATLWRTRQFEYQWLRALSGRYLDFWSVTASALDFSARSLALPLTPAARDLLMSGFSSLQVWPDVPAALATLRRSGSSLIILSNVNVEMLRKWVDVAGIGDRFADLLSTERVRSFKPDPRAYQLGVDSLRMPRQQILFVPSAGWDAAGALWFGYPTFWNNRQAAPLESLDASPDGVGASLQDLVTFLETGDRAMVG